MSDQPSVVVLGDVWLHRRVADKVIGHNMLAQDVLGFPGGAAYTAMALAALGRKTQLIAIASVDEAGVALHGMCQDIPNLWPRFSSVLAGTPTYVSTRRLTGDRTGHWETLPAPFDASFFINQALGEARAVGPVQAYVIVDAGLGTVPDPVIRAVISAGPTFVLAPYYRLTADRYGGATAVLTTSTEALQWAYARGNVHPALDPTNAEAIGGVVAPAIQRELGAALAIVTCNRDGAVTAVPETQPFMHIRYHKATARLPVLTTKAILAFGVGAVEAYLRGMELQPAMRFANLLGFLAARETNPAIITEDDVDAWMLELRRPSEEKMRSVAEAAAMRARLEAKGQRVAVVSGGFDYFTGGHEYILTRNIDSVMMALVRRQGQVDLGVRCRRVAAFADVVVVVDDAEAAIRQIRPNVIYVGEEHRGRPVPGIDFVASRGGDVQFFPMQPVAPDATSDIHPPA